MTVEFWEGGKGRGGEPLELTLLLQTSPTQASPVHLFPVPLPIPLYPCSSLWTLMISRRSFSLWWTTPRPRTGRPSTSARDRPFTLLSPPFHLEHDTDTCDLYCVTILVPCLDLTLSLVPPREAQEEEEAAAGRRWTSSQRTTGPSRRR